MYSIIDIESSGGKYSEEKIIEIAIYVFDGKEIIDSFSSLVNPEKKIDAYVQKLTGITEKMVKRAPKFHEIAKKIITLTENTTLVAHNAEFDYRMLKQEFKSLGFEYKKNTIDTIILSKHLLPDLPSYSLSKLCKTIGIALTDKHRAFGDALATVELFKLLLEKDSQKKIIKKAISNKIYGKFAPKILEMIEELPHKAGVYYLHNKNGKIVFVGNSYDISHAVLQHFTSEAELDVKIQQKTDKISYELTGSELIAEIKSHAELTSIKPALNKLLKRGKILKSKEIYPEKNLIFHDKGRTQKEKSFFEIENHKFKGYGYFELNNQLKTKELRENRMNAIKETAYVKNAVLAYLKKKTN